MALSSNSVFEIRTTGADTNGGGFVTGASGTDRSQQNAAHATLSVASVVHSTTTQINVSAGDYTVTANDVGNILQITGGTATAGFYQITVADVPNNRWTVDRSAGTAGQTVVGAMGGALASVGKFGSVAYTAGNIVWIKSGTYSITSASTNVSNGCFFNNGGAGIRMEGYDSTRGDLGTKPLLQASGISTFTILNFNTNNCHIIRNLKLDGGSLTSSRGMSFRDYADRVEVVNCTNSAFHPGTATTVGPVCHRCSASGCATQEAFLGVSCESCVAFNNTISGFSNNANNPCHFIGCIADSNSGASSDGFQFGGSVLNGPTLVFNCTAYNNGRDGFRVNTGTTKSSFITNCIAEDNGAFGFNNSSSPTGGFAQLFNCAGFSNASGETSGYTGSSSANNDFITLTSTAFTDAPNQDFSLNATVGGGADLIDTGIPGAFPQISTTGFNSIGAAQPEVGGAAGGEHSAVF